MRLPQGRAAALTDPAAVALDDGVAGPDPDRTRAV